MNIQDDFLTLARLAAKTNDADCLLFLARVRRHCRIELPGISERIDEYLKAANYKPNILREQQWANDHPARAGMEGSG